MTILVSDCALGPDNSIRVVIKYSIDIADTRTGLASRARESAAPGQQHSIAVDDLLAAGHQIVGKAVMHELAFGVTGINPYSGTPLNPQYPNLIPSRSSSGSAVAVAAGIADYALGTDTGGSVCFPAVCCDVFGHKPTFGRVSRIGAWPANSSLDCIGPFASNLATLQIAQQAD